MILSKKNKFVFVKGQKVAGTSLEVLLSAVCGPEDIITPITPIDERYRVKSGQISAQNYGANDEEYNEYISSLRDLPKDKLTNIKRAKGTYYNHMPFVEILELFGEIPDDWTIVAAERCPYRKIISLANMQINFKHYKTTGYAMNSDINLLKQHLSRIIENETFTMVKNINLYKDHEGTVKTQILRYEELEEDVVSLMSKLGISTYPGLQHFKRGLSSNDMDLHDIFSTRQLHSINELFYEEFNTFGYSMIE